MSMATSKKLSQVEFHKKEILVNLIRDFVLNEALPKPLNDRVNNVIAYSDAKKCLKKFSQKLPNSENYTPIGISLRPQQLNQSEKQLLRKNIENHILNTYPDLFKKLNDLTNNELNNALHSSKIDCGSLSSEQKKVIALCEKYQTILEELHKTNIEMCHAMKEWIDIRLSSMIISLGKKLELCKYNSKIVELKTKIVNLRVKKFVYSGNTAIRDYMDYYLNMKEQLENCKSEIYNYKKLLSFDDD